jgi:hypothetical protein
MNAKLQRVVRTATSEEIVIRDMDELDKEGSPRTIGKLDVHYTDEGVYGTLLLWPELVDGMAKADLDAFIEDDLIGELTGVIGVTESYNIELYSPDMKRYKLFSNLPEE